MTLSQWRRCKTRFLKGSSALTIQLLLDFIVWEDAKHGQNFLKSTAYRSAIIPIFKELSGGEEPEIRHTTLHHQALGDPFGPKLLGYPIGTAIYTGTDVAWQHAWPLWTHIVRHVDGCRGIAGGKVAEPVDGLENGYVVYVAWQTVKHHDDYHHTEHFHKRWIILQTGCQGWVEYGHIVFVEIRNGKGESEPSKI